MCTTSSYPSVLVTLTFASLRPHPRGGVRGRASLSTPCEHCGTHAAVEAGRATAPRCLLLTHSPLVQVVRCKLLARDGCCVLDAATRSALPTPACALRPPVCGCAPLAPTPWTASCSQARRGRPPFTSHWLAEAVSSRGELHVEGCCLGSRGRIYVREGRGWGGWSGRDHFSWAAQLILSLSVHGLFSVDVCSHHSRGTQHCSKMRARACVRSVCVPRVVCLPQLARARDCAEAL